MVSARHNQATERSEPLSARSTCTAAPPILAWSGSWESLLETSARLDLETAVLPRFLQAQRWFGGKSRKVGAVRVNAPLLVADNRGALTFASVEYPAGEAEEYFLPLALATGRAAELQQDAEPASVVARLEGPDGTGILFDGLLSREVVTALVDLIGNDRSLGSAEQVLQGSSMPALPRLLRSRGDRYRISRGPSTSSNSFMIVGDHLFLKVFRRLEPGINPDVEIGEYLSESGSTAHVPQLAGTLTAHSARGVTTLAVLQELVDNEGNGWARVMQQLDRYFSTASGKPEAPSGTILELNTSEPPQTLYRPLAESRVLAGLLGTRTAELHLALAAGHDFPTFAPEMMSSEDFDRLRQSLHDQADQAVMMLKEQYGDLGPDDAEAAARLLARELEIPRRIDASVPSRCAALRHRVHGDYHLGQVLWTGQDFVILDFEGEPMRPLEERRAKQSPFKDVAGMLRSFHYAALTAARTFADDKSLDARAWAHAWYVWTSAAFLRDYLLTTRIAGLVPENTAQMHALLDAFLLEKAFYELAYELNNRPEWVGIPLRGLLDLIPSPTGGVIGASAARRVAKT